MHYFEGKIFGIGLIGLLVGCGGGGSSTPTASGPTYENWNSTASSTSTLRGTTAIGNGSTNKISLANSTGSVTHSTGALTVNDGTYSLTDPDGFNAAGVATDGSSTITSDGNQGFTGTYEYVRAYQQNYTVGGTNYTVAGISGIATSASDMPSSASVLYVGEARGVIGTPTTGTLLTNGRSSVNVNFGGTVNVVLENFIATDEATGNPVNPTVDKIEISGMNIAGNAFTGGTLITTKDGATVNVTGANTVTGSQGVFYGYDAANNRPDEVGGLTVSQGDDGLVVGTFIAD